MRARISQRGFRLALLLRSLVLGTTLSLLFACSPIRGYPENPVDSDQTIADLTAAVASLKLQYDQAERQRSLNPAPLTSLRNRIILKEMEIYEIYFSRFQARLWGDNNVITTGGDLAVLVLNGLAATTGGAATKSALAAASFGIVGAQGAINRDIYYQRTLPAVLAQMSANRDRIKAAILDAISKKDDVSYPLDQAELDLQVLQRASGIADAVQAITQQATDQMNAAQALVDTYRTAEFSNTASAQRIRAWIGFGNDPRTGQPFLPNAANLAALQKWVDANAPGIPVAQLLDDKQGSEAMQQKRQQAISDLHIPP